MLGVNPGSCLNSSDPTWNTGCEAGGGVGGGGGAWELDPSPLLVLLLVILFVETLLLRAVSCDSSSKVSS